MTNNITLPFPKKIILKDKETIRVTYEIICHWEKLSYGKLLIPSGYVVDKVRIVSAYNLGKPKSTH